MIKHFDFHSTPSYKPNPWSRILPFLRHILPLIVFVSTTTEAQVLSEVGQEEARLDTNYLHTLRLDIDALGFFRDNEYESKIHDGYSLPGVRFTPHLAYTPIEQINIEAGASMLFFNGANKYPCYAYHDIGTWKGNQYQSGAHALPWIRLQASFKDLDIILGNIYGGTNHKLITPLYNAEQTISSDPEMGAQILVNKKRYQLDIWLDWQSYQFETDTHQEAFTVGICSEVKWNKSRDISLYSPLAVIAQHRGGEQDLTSLGVQTIGNVSAGIGIRKEIKSFFNGYDATVNAMACYQQSGKLWPFDTGFAWHMGIKTLWWNHVNAAIDYVNIPKQFVSLYGNPFYNSLSLVNGGTTLTPEGGIEGKYTNTYSNMHNVRLGLDYKHTFAKAYTLGVDLEMFCLKADNLHEFNFSFGLYLHVSPSVILKRFRD